MTDPLQALLARTDVWQASRGRPGNQPDTVLPSGHPALDATLHQGGWPRAALTEVHTDHYGIGELQLLAPALADCSRGPRRVFIVGAPFIPYAPALQGLGARLERLRIVTPQASADSLWCIEQILRSGACGCLLAWLPAGRGTDYRALRRLQLAARATHGPVFLFRATRATRELSPAALRLGLHATAGGLDVRILKQRGGRAGQRVRLARDTGLLQARIEPAMLPVVLPPCSVPDTDRQADDGLFRGRAHEPASRAALH